MSIVRRKSAGSPNGAGSETEQETKKTKAEKRQRFERRLVKYEELPKYLRDNEFILDYYRCEWPLKDAVLNVFSWHNETFNVWMYGRPRVCLD